MAKKLKTFLMIPTITKIVVDNVINATNVQSIFLPLFSSFLIPYYILKEKLCKVVGPTLQKTKAKFGCLTQYRQKEIAMSVFYYFYMSIFCYVFK